jgi:hypothetical protein
MLSWINGAEPVAAKATSTDDFDTLVSSKDDELAALLAGPGAVVKKAPSKAPASPPIKAAAPVATKPTDLVVYGVPFKHVVLLMLTVQNAGAVLLMRYTRSMPGQSDFSTQTAVIMQEALKGVICVAILLATEGSLASAWAVPSEALKTSVPAFLYLGQNNLQ